MFGTYLYANNASDLRLRTDTGLDFTLWHSGNARSDSQNDTRYSQIGHTHAISDVTGLQAALDAKTGGTGTPGRYPKYATSSTFTDGMLSESGINVIANGGVIVSDTPFNSSLRGFGLWASGVIRWGLGKAGNETGSDAGSDFTLWSYSDGGTYLREPLRISRATGNATFSGTISASGGNSGNWNTAFSWGNHSGLYVPVARTVSAGTGLTGGGALSANISLAFDTTYSDGRYAALAHTHAIADVTGLQVALDGKNSGTGTVNQVPLFIGANTFGDSIMSQSTGNIYVAGQLFSNTPVNTNVRGFNFQSGGANRWAVGKAGSETGSNAGSDYVWWRYNDAGAYLGEAFRMSRATGNATFSGTVTVSGGNSTNWNTAFSWGNHASAGYVPTSRTITINGTTLDLSANRSWTISGGGIPGSLSDKYVPRYDSASSSFVNSSIEETATSVDIKKSTTINKNGSFYYLGVGGSLNTFGISFYNTAGTNAFSFGRYNDEFSFTTVNGTTVYEIKSDNLFTFVNPNGLQPFKVNSSTLIPNLNADMVDGLHASSFALASSLSSYVPTARTITINGTTFDLSANRSWTISGGIGGGGTTGKIPVFTAGTTIGDSILSVSGVNVTAAGQFQSDAAPAAGPRGFYLSNANVARWSIGKFGSETGSDAGSDLVFMRYNDGGSLLGTAMSISRANGNVTLSGGISVSGGNSGQWNTAYNWGNHASAGYASNSSLSNYVPTSRTITINGTTYDLSANRSWTISGGGSSTLAGLSDVFISGPSDYQPLIYVSGAWRNFSMGWVTGSGSNARMAKWNGGSSITSSEIWEISNSVLIGSNGNRRDLLVVEGSLVPQQMSQSQRLSYSPGYIGAIVYQTDGTAGLYVAKDNGSGGHTWVYVG
ncbi:hypothetical protein [Dyadobacter soli]|uniref:hypothetical protein n=1 Tax=Dyadobacter soli TaxID=659014 RepID=UPI0015A021B8|nr:hypothetical protein [Dyadobacter soli]